MVREKTRWTKDVKAYADPILRQDDRGFVLPIGLIFFLGPLSVEMKNDGNLYGAVWAETADMKNAATIYYDVSLRDEYQSNEIVVTGWKEELD